MHVLGPVSALAVLLVVSPVAAEQTTADRSESELAKVEAWLHDVAMTLQINSDPVLRAILCRIPFQHFTLEALHLATGVPRQRLLRGAERLAAMNLVRLEPDEGEWISIVPYDGEVEKKMRAWAYDWCASDESCGVTW
jgi:hypothetical protein